MILVHVERTGIFIWMKPTLVEGEALVNLLIRWRNDWVSVLSSQYHVEIYRGLTSPWTRRDVQLV